ncbi:hypothetical protein [uncultured Jatrophihabitans sp.]|uniref:hypothetical protein n=1 Tax=uncultured Jatrophihabitans sp. TaxID=1610747 RepID=UPI0035CA6DBB
MSADTAYVPAEPVMPRAQRSTGRDLLAGLVIVLVLAVIGAVLGFVWAQWTPTRPAAQVLGGGKFIVDETEGFIAGDGRYLVLTAVVGLLAAVGAYLVLPARRGVAVTAGLVAGGLAGAALTQLVGWLAGGGSATGRLVTVTGGSYRLTDHVPLSLHMSGLVVVEAAVSALVYGLLVAFATQDDLGRPDPVRDRLVAARGVAVPGPAPSVHPGGHPQYGGGHGDAAGPAQQGDLPPQ